MKKSYLIIGVVVIILLVVLIFFSKNGHKENGYYIYNNIPSYLNYTSYKDFIPEEYKINRNDFIEKYLIRTASEGKDISEAFGIDSEKYICVNGGELEIVNIFHDTCDWLEKGALGCGYERKAIICGDIYFIEQYMDATGPIIYGPFRIEN